MQRKVKTVSTSLAQFQIIQILYNSIPDDQAVTVLI